MRLVEYSAYLISGSRSAVVGIVKTADTHTFDPVSVALFGELDAILVVVISGGRISFWPASGNELIAIAAVVLGGTLLTGGVGMVAGTLFGGMIQGLIATLINFNGSLNGAWIMITSGVLLFLFIVMQRSLVGSFSLRRTA